MIVADFCLLNFAIIAMSSCFSSIVKVMVFLELRARSGSSLQFKVNSKCIMSFISLSNFASPYTEWLRSRLRWPTTISGFSSMKYLDHRCLISGSEKNLARTALLLSLNTSTRKTRSTGSISSGRDLRMEQGKTRVRTLIMLE